MNLEAARAAELGAGEPRDYERAAQIYEHLCLRGSGSIEACLDLVDAIADARGTTRDLHRINELSDALCKRGDPTSCLMYETLHAMAHGDAVDPASYDRAARNAATACERGDSRACEMSVMGGDSGTAEQDRREKYSVASRAGRMDACGRVAVELDMCDEATDALACEHGIVAEWRAHDYDSDLAADAQKLSDECDAGNARACDHIPTRRIAMTARCAAHDYGACADLGCLGDDAAKAAAVAHGIDDPNCGVALQKAMLEWKRDAHHGRFEPIATDGQRPLGAQPTPPWEAVRFQHHGGRDRNDWPRFDVHNMNTHAVTELSICEYAYDGSGAQLARFAAHATGTIAPNALIPLALDAPTTQALPDGTRDVIIDYAHVRFDDGTGSDDPSRCAEQHAPAGAYMHW